MQSNNSFVFCKTKPNNKNISKLNNNITFLSDRVIACVNFKDRVIAFDNFYDRVIACVNLAFDNLACVNFTKLSNVAMSARALDDINTRC